MAHDYLMVELFVPRTNQNREAIFTFYRSLGWRLWSDTEDRNLIYTMPDIKEGSFVGYWLTVNPDTCSAFRSNWRASAGASWDNSHVLVLPATVEPALVLGSSLVVEAVWERASAVLIGKDATVDPAQYGKRYPGVAGFRFTDPFGHRIRVTTDPGYEFYRQGESSSL